MLLPYLEQQPLYNAANFNWRLLPTAPRADAVNSTVYLTRIGSFLCPSDGLGGRSEHQQLRREPRIHDPHATTPNGTGITNGIVHVYNSANQASSVTIAAVTDGTSNTIAFGEALVGDAAS